MRRARDILREDRGVSIVFAVLLVVVLLILGGIVLSYGYSNFHRATTDVTSEQNYQTVSSAAKLVRSEMDGVALTKTNGVYSSNNPSWVGDLLNLNLQKVTVSGFNTVDVTAKPAPGGGSYTIYCSESDTSSITLKFPINLTGAGSNWNVSSLAPNGQITKVGE